MFRRIRLMVLVIAVVAVTADRAYAETALEIL